MKRQDFGLITKVGIIILIFSFILLPISPSISMAEEGTADADNRLAALSAEGQDDEAAAAGMAAAGDAAGEGITKKKLVIGALVAAAAVGLIVALDDDDDDIPPTTEHP